MIAINLIKYAGGITIIVGVAVVVGITDVSVSIV